MILQFLLGFTASFLGTTPPGMLNLTSLKISLEKGKRKSYHFAFGVAIVIFIQTYVSLIFASYLRQHSFIETYIQIIGFVIFSLLSTYFFYSSIKEKKKLKNTSKKINNTFILGLGLSSLNLLAIPFYCSVGSTLNMYGWLAFNQISMLFFVFGSALGAFTLLSIYNNSANIIQKKVGLLSKNFNVILGCITGLISLITLIQLL